MRASQRKHNWREKHDDFIHSIRAARGEPTDEETNSYSKQDYGREQQYDNSRNYGSGNQKQNSLKNTGGDDTLPTRRGPAPRAGFIQCPHCGRNFAEESGTNQDHVPMSLT